MKPWFVVFMLACGSSPPPGPAPAPAPATKSDDAVALDAEGQQLMAAGNYAGAEKKFIAAYNRDPKARYCFDLCTSEQQLGKLQLALNACKKVGLHDPTPELKAKADQTMQSIRDTAKAQNVELE
jgi:tetratricopeptide (TPR) repeat protein